MEGGGDRAGGGSPSRRRELDVDDMQSAVSVRPPCIHFLDDEEATAGAKQTGGKGAGSGRTADDGLSVIMVRNHEKSLAAAAQRELHALNAHAFSFD